MSEFPNLPEGFTWKVRPVLGHGAELVISAHDPRGTEIGYGFFKNERQLKKHAKHLAKLCHLAVAVPRV